MSYRKAALTLLILAGLAAAALAVPIPWHIESAFLVQPDDVQNVYVSVPGRLDDLRVRPGQRVAEGDVLAILRNDDLQAERQQLLTRKESQQKAIARYLHLEDPAREHLARERLRSIQEQLRDVEQRLAQLVIRAPRAGQVVAPPRIAEPKLKRGERQLSTWYGTPLDPENSGCYLEAQTHLLSIAPNDRLEGVLLIDQADRNDLDLGETVELKFEHLPDRTYEGTVREISLRHLEFAPAALSNKLGGNLATMTDPQGRERLISIAYQATVLLEEDTHLLKPGMRGTARFLVAERTAGDWLWRYLRQTFNFRL